MKVIKRDGTEVKFNINKIKKVAQFATEGFDRDIYSPDLLVEKVEDMLRDGMKTTTIQQELTQIALEQSSPKYNEWQNIAGKLHVYSLYKEASINRGYYGKFGYGDFRSLIDNLIDVNRYGAYIRDGYTDEQIKELGEYIKPERDYLFTYMGIKLLSNRYLKRGASKEVMELPQERFMIMSMHLALNEDNFDKTGKNKMKWVKRFYDVFSQLKATMATPTLSNAGTPHPQLSSCFIETADDSLKSIMHVNNQFSEVSKHGGGMGIYYGKVRANGSDIRGHKGASGGLVPWARISNDISVAVDQLGVRQGAVSIWTDAWHKDMPEWLGLRTNNGDDRKKAHDVFPGVCFPDLFWKMADEDLNQTWYLMCPHEIRKTKGYNLEDSWGEEWEEKYWECVADPAIDKREILLKDLVRLLITSWTETGTPFTFNRDTVNRYNPNKHMGMIYSSNLCTEVLQVMSPAELGKQDIITTKDGRKLVVTTDEAGDFVVCNLSSTVLGRTYTQEDIAYVMETQIRAMDNVIDLNYYPTPYAEVTNKGYRAVGAGTSGYHHMLADKYGVAWESEEHLEVADKVYEWLNFYAIKTSMELAKERGSYSHFEGSDWQTGDYFKLRDYNNNNSKLDWNGLASEVAKNGLRNAHLLAIAPTGSTAGIAGTSEGIDPIQKKFIMKEKKGLLTPEIAPELSPKNFWLYKTAHELDQNWSIRANATRQRHIDQGQSFNLFIRKEATMRQRLDLYINAWKEGVKTVYYVRGESDDIKDCESCSA